MLTSPSREQFKAYFSEPGYFQFTFSIQIFVPALVMLTWKHPAIASAESTNMVAVNSLNLKWEG